MDGFKLLISFVLISSLLFPATLDAFIAQNTEPADAVEKVPLLPEGSGYTLIKVNGDETFIFSEKTGSQVQSQAEIQAALSADIYAKGEYSQKVSSASDAITSFRAQKDADEKKCSQYLGVDKLPCTDKQTCIVACFAVPLCSALIQAPGFYEAMLDYTQKTQKINTELSQAEAQLSTFQKTDIDSTAAKLSSIIDTSINLSTNNMFRNRTDPGCDKFDSRCFEFCKKTNYSTGGLETAREGILSLNAVVSEADAQASRSAEISASTEAELKFSQEKGTKFSQLQSSVSSRLSSIQASYANFSSNASSLEIEAKISALKATQAEITKLGGEGNFKLALAKGQEFESASASASSEISSTQAKYSALSSSYASLSAKYNSASDFIAPDSQEAKDYRAISQKMSTKISASEMTSLQGSISSLDSRLDAVIADAALSGKPVKAQGQPAIPCMPAIAILFLGFASLYLSRK